MNKSFYKIIIIIVLPIFFGCSNYLEREPEGFLTYEDIFSDPKLLKSLLSNIYGRVNWGQNIDNDNLYIFLDEACLSNGSPNTTYGFSDDFMRVYDYKLIRDINEFLEGLRSDAGNLLDETLKRQTEGELRFLRAWTYFNMCKCLGGMPIVGDKVFEYTQGMNVVDIQMPRSKEYEVYDYIINETDTIAKDFLTSDLFVNGARVNKWAALALKARAALYAGSLAKYNNLMSNPIITPSNEVGIPAQMANDYYKIALEASEEIIKGGRYKLYDKENDKRKNFYETISKKEGNTEVIWALDHSYPSNTTLFTNRNVPTSVAEDESSTNITPVLNLVEAFEYINERNGELRTKDVNGNYIFYDNAEDLFTNKDPRLWGTIIYPGSEFKGEEIVFQAGRKYFNDGVWLEEISTAGSSDEKGVITSINGPIMTNDGQRNKTGFCIRKFLDEQSQASTRQGSTMWFIRFRYAEILMIASESSFELGDNIKALNYINLIRKRAGIDELSEMTLHDIVRERRVEFAFEDHRYWDLKRWRMAHVKWNGDRLNKDAVHRVLFPFKIEQKENPNHGKWIFDERDAHMTTYPLLFEMKNYYNFLDQNWLNNNPKLTKNPYQ